MSEDITSLTDEIPSFRNNFGETASNTTTFTFQSPNLDLPATLDDFNDLPLSENTDTGGVCKYFVHGICRFGETCRNSHTVVEVDAAAAVAAIATVDTESESENESASAITAEAIITKVQLDPARWVHAPEFIPKTYPTSSAPPTKSYAQIVGTNNESKQVITFDVASCSSETQRAFLEFTRQTTTTPLCPYIFDGKSCRNGVQCPYVHGFKCEYCNFNCLHPTDMEQQAIHKNDCIKQHQDDMELSFAVARSKDKTCGICFEVIMEKSGREQRFGILPNCNHIFCLQCIRTWRQAKQFENKIIRACPECRVTSDFICPSVYWVDTKDEKEQLIASYQVALKEKDCKYFKKGYGVCPFGNKCFYKHALPNGTTIDVGMPQRKIVRQNHLGDTDILQQIFLWDFLADHDLQLLDDLATIIRSDSSESDWSD